MARFQKGDIVATWDGVIEIEVEECGDKYFSGTVLFPDSEKGYKAKNKNVSSFRVLRPITPCTDLLLEIKQELEVIKEKLNKAINKPERWRADMGEEYYCINSYFGVGGCYEDNDDADGHLYLTGNYFQTREEAQKYADRMKQLLLNREL